MRRLYSLFLLTCFLCLSVSACSTPGEARLASPLASPGLLTPDGSPPAVEGASDVALRCTGTQLVRYQPGLTNQAHSTTISASATYGSCTSSTDTSDPIAGGSSSYQVTDTDRSCHGGHAPTVVLETYQWVSAQGRTLSSQVKYTHTDLHVEPGSVQITSNGSVQTGVDMGEQVQRTLTLTDQDPAACQSTAGLQSVAGTVSLVFSKSVA